LLGEILIGRWRAGGIEQHQDSMPLAPLDHVKSL
jgi:hypothetical protein